MTASELARMIQREVYAIRPRLTELEKRLLVKTNGKRWNDRTQRNEAVYFPEQKPKELF
ncbi:hypothetical protein D3C83_318150 [compost metagenome]